MTLDELSLGLLEASFQTGPSPISAGYNFETFSQYSSIIIHFDTVTTDGFLQDLGTGQKNNSEVGCVATRGLTVSIYPRLQCTLVIGTSAEFLPKIIVSGYNEIAPFTTITLLFTNIRSLKAGVAATITYGVQLTYKGQGSVTAFFYGPTAITPPVTSAGNAIIPSVETVTPVPLDSKVLQTTDYTFSFTLGSTTSLGVNDFVLLKFPAEYF